MTEAFLHYVWQHQMFASREHTEHDCGLTTTDGQPVVVLHAGEPNHDAGPDFFNARLRINGLEWAGNVEIHIHSSDWNVHRHQRDAAYNNVILHVVYEHDADIVLQNGKIPPTLELKPYLHPSLVSNYETLMAPSAANAIPCSGRVGEVPSFMLTSYLERLTVERIEAKAATVRRLLEESHGGWEQTCYWLLARYFGGKVNALPFELLAKSTDPRLLARWADNRQRLEALLMGQAGLLEGYFEDDYPRALQADYEALRAGAGLSPIGDYLWKFYCLRPSSFPTIRISQFADLMAQTRNLFATILPMTDVKELERLFSRRAAPYWDTHYQFDQATAKASVKHIGRMQADLLIINAWVPLLFIYGVDHGQQHYKDQALHLLTQLAAENNAVVRRWQEAGVSPSNAAESQALLQLTNNYCSQRRCLECRIGYQLLKHT